MCKLVITWWFVFTTVSVHGQNLRFNELVSRNVSTCVDDYGEYEDWIELFNGSRRDIDLGGWYISDDGENPGKTRIPDTDPRITLIPAGSYLVLWADRDTVQGPLHINLKLSREGETVYLSRKDQNRFILVDSVSYPVISNDISYGYCSNGVKGWRLLDLPTPGMPNNCPYKGIEQYKTKKSRR
jgi:hypothetical protein